MAETDAGRPGGRPSLFPGKDKPATFTLRADTKDKIAEWSRFAGCSRSDFMEGLAQRYGAALALDLKREADGRKHESGIPVGDGSDLPPAATSE